MRGWVDGNLKRFWRKALQEVLEDQPEVESEIERWESLSPADSDLADFYGTYVWAVYNAGFKIEVLDSLWGRLREALCDFDVDAVAANRDVVRSTLMTIVSHSKKTDAVVETAVKLARRPQLWDRMQRLSSSAFLDEVQEFKGIGPDNRYHVARNLGWNVPNHSGFTRALAEDLRTDCDTLMGYISKVSGFRISTTDIIIGIWSRLPDHESDQECIERFRLLIGLDG